MKLCDDCIKALSSKLSEESVNTLRNSLELFTNNQEITLRDLWEVNRLGKYRMNEVIGELEESLFLKANKEGRRVYLELTATGQRFMEIDLENRLATESNLKESSDELQALSVKGIDGTEESKEEALENSNIDNTESREEESEEVEEVVEEVVESKPAVEKEKNLADNNKSDDKSKPIVWDF